MMPRFNEYRIRDLKESDLRKVLEWRNSDRIRSNAFSDGIITMDEHEAWFKRLNQDQTRECKVFEHGGKSVGIINLLKIDRRNRRCTWGLYMGETEVPRGTGVVMGYLALEYIFEELNIRKLCAEVLSFNTTSIKFHRKLGFSMEGVYKAHVFKSARYVDVILMALFDHNWAKLKNELAEQCFGREANERNSY